MLKEAGVSALLLMIWLTMMVHLIGAKRIAVAMDKVESYVGLEGMVKRIFLKVN